MDPVSFSKKREDWRLSSSTERGSQLPFWQYVEEEKEIGAELVDTDMNLKKGNTHNILDNRTFSFISTTV